MSADVAITGVGVVGAFGVGLEDLARGLMGAPPRTVRHAVGAASLEVGQATWKLREHWPGLPIKLGRVDRGSKMFLIAGRQALTGAGLDGSEPAAVVLGTRFGCLLVNESYHRGLLIRGRRLASPLEFGYTVPSAPAGELSIAARLTGPNLTLVCGDAAGGAAVARAAGWIRSGRVERAIAGGCDAQGAWLARELYDGGVRDGDGPIPAEGAAALVLESVEAARARGARVLALLGAVRQGFRGTPAGAPGFVDPLADVIGRTYAAAAPLAVAAMAGLLLPPDRVRVEDELGHRVELEVMPAPPAGGPLRS